VAPPQSRVGPLSEQERTAILARSPLRGRYERPIDRESAYEILAARAQQEAQRAPEADTGPARSSELGDQVGEFAGKVIRSALNQAASQLGRQLVRGLLGSLMGRKR